MPIYEEIFYLGTGRYVDFMRSSLRRNLITRTDRLTYAEISAQTQEIVAGNDELARTFGEGFDATNRTLEWGFSNIADRLSEISSAIEDLRANFNYNIGLVIEQMQIQNKLITEVIGKLDAIHKTLESPLLTQAREFYRIGAERLQRGLLDKTLEAFLKAEEKNDTDFFTEFQLGKLYLYGIDEDDNIIDLQKAKEHLRFAIRYGKGELKVLPDFNRWVGEACFHASIACYVSVNEPEIKENPTEVKRLLGEAYNLAKESCEIYPQISEAYYHYAKFSALLGDAENTVSNLEKAILMDRRYCIKAEIDKDFDVVRPKVIELYEKLRKDSEIKARELLDQAKGHLSKVYIYSEEGKKVKEEAEKLIHDAEILIKKNTYFSYLDAIPYLNKAIEISSFYYEKGTWTNCMLYKTLEGREVEITSINNYMTENYSLPIAFSSDSKFFINGCKRYSPLSITPEYFIQIRDINGKEFVREFSLGRGSYLDFTTAAISLDSKFLAVYAFPGNIIQIWDVNKGKFIRGLPSKEKETLYLEFLDSKFLAVVNYDKNSIQIWDVNDGNLIRTLELKRKVEGVDGDYYTTQTMFSPDCKFFVRKVQRAFDYTEDYVEERGLVIVQIWDVNKGMLIRTLKEESNYDFIPCVISPNNTLLAGYDCVSSNEILIQIRDLNNLRLIKTLGKSHRVDSMEFSPDGEFLVVTSIRDPGTTVKIRIWCINDGSLIFEEDIGQCGLLHTEAECICGTAFSPDGKFLASIEPAREPKKLGGRDWRNAIKIWRRNV
jgi:WD40 repeat protein